MLKDNWITGKVGWVNATELTRVGNEVRFQMGRKPIRLDSYLRNMKTKEFMEEVENIEGVLYTYIPTPGRNGYTLMHPIVALEYSWYLSPEDKVEFMSEWYKGSEEK